MSLIETSFLGGQHEQIFQDVMRRTANTALGFQAYYTGLGRTAYYDMLSYFDVADHRTISWFQSALFPQSSRGLSGVIGVLCIHLLLASLVTLTFLTTTRASCIGDNAW